MIYTREIYGPMQVFLDGQNIGHITREVDPDEGWALVMVARSIPSAESRALPLYLLERGPDGRRDVVMARAHGKITLRPLDGTDMGDDWRPERKALDAVPV